MEKQINIIGAGIAGLSAGCYLQMNGYRTEIFELHTLPGGLCTSWNKGGYTIDGCLHWLVGSGPGDNYYPLWNEIVDLRNMEFIDSEEFFRMEDHSGNFIRVLCDIDALEEEFLKKAPEDKTAILELTRAVRRFATLDMPVDKATETYSLKDYISAMFRFLPHLGSLKKWSRITLEEWATRFKNDLLRNTIKNLFVPEMAALFGIFTLAWMHKKSAGYPIGGSLKFSQRIAERYLQLGGKIQYRSRVNKITTAISDGKTRAMGIILENGEAYPADIVISAADGHATLFEMLGEEFLDVKTKGYYEKYPVFSSYLQVSLGIARTFEEEPFLLAFPLQEPIIVDDQTKTNEISFRIFSFDPTLAPSGKTLITCMLGTYNNKYWSELRCDNPGKYKAEKQRIADEVIAALDKRLGNIRNLVEMTDVSTPATVIRYTNNWKGSFEGWILSPVNALTQMRKTLPGLRNFYMAGQWVEPGGGVPAAFISGRNVAQIVCKNDRKKFSTTSFLG